MKSITNYVFPLQVYIENSGSTGGLQYPFGYLKASTNLTSVNLFIMPYNYPKLIPLIGKQHFLERGTVLQCQNKCFFKKKVFLLCNMKLYTFFVYMIVRFYNIILVLDELSHAHMRPSSNWKAEFADYLTTLPCYYIQVCCIILFHPIGDILYFVAIT